MTQVLISNAIIDSLLNNPEALKELPFLKAGKMIADARSKFQANRKTCCGGTTGDRKNGSVIMSHTYQSLKKQLANLTPRQQAFIRKLLGVDRVSVEYRVGLKELRVDF